MNWTPSQQEIASVLSMNGQERYAYWIKKIADQEIIWSLWQENGWALGEDDSSRVLIPVWPHAEYSALAAKDTWVGYKPKAIALDVWLNQWTPGIEKDRRLVAVFPALDDRGVVVDPIHLEKDIREEILQYE